MMAISTSLPFDGGDGEANAFDGDGALRDDVAGKGIRGSLKLHGRSGDSEIIREE